MIKVYLARAMTGRLMRTVYLEARRQKRYLESHGFYVLDPVAEENVRPKKQRIQTNYRQLVRYWTRDKEMIREAHVVFDMTPWLKSEGVAHEIGYARYFLWKPIVRVYSKRFARPSKGSVAFFEDDLLATDMDHAIRESKKRWGTWFKRLKWRLSLYNRSFLKAIFYKLQGWF